MVWGLLYYIPIREHSVHAAFLQGEEGGKVSVGAADTLLQRRRAVRPIRVRHPQV